MLFDSHAHINNGGMTPETRQALAEAIERSSLDYVMDIGFDLESSRLAAEHAARYSWCYAAVGCHPHDAKGMDDMQLALIKGLTKKAKVMAIGEIGLDFHYDHSPRDVQREWFRKQIRLANELKMPIVIHSREADQEVMDILKEEGAFSDERKSWFPKRPDTQGYVHGKGGKAPFCDDARVLLHCFSGSKELGSQYVKLGATLSIAGPVTYKNNKKTVAVVEEIPMDFLLVETDSPYLTPEPFRGKKNTPPMVEYTARKVAEIKGMNFEDVAAITKTNAMRFYGIAG
ncbi:MAG: TatD family hydrolase [Bacillota bacterium]|nr:TatD family hydrolase [Bacillota bacterium]